MQETLLMILTVVGIIAIIVLILVLMRVFNLLKTVNQMVEQSTTSIHVLTKDVDQLSVEVEGLLNKSNHLLNDINLKLEKTDPVFAALGDLGVSVSHINESATKLTKNVKLKRQSGATGNSSNAIKIGKTLFKLLTKTKK